MTLAGARYLKKLNETFAKANESGANDAGTVLAVTYLKGLYDMAALCMCATRGDSVAELISQIDANVIAYEQSEYGEEDDDAAEDPREP